ncbi:MAG: calcium/sodium antiporter [Butyricicoccus sp.]|nr:calcium/sodium antiporter [Butyricicoccus sp.]
MNIWLALLLSAAGIVLLVKGGDWFVDAACDLAQMAGIPPFIIGATVVSLATTLPEMIVSVIAAAGGKTEMAIGNAVGSVTANTGLIMALAMLFLPMAAPRERYGKQCVLLMAAAAALFAGSQGGSLSIWADAALALVFIGFMFVNVSEARRDMSGGAEEKKAGKNSFWKDIALFVVGTACIVVGSDMLVDGGSAVAAAMGVPERVIAVTMVAIGTSLPELVTTLTAIRKKEASLSIGNIIGANIIDLSLILPICSLVSGQALPVSAQSAGLDMGACLVITAFAMASILVYKKAGRVQGAVCLALYAAYLAISM